jgi:hypothetical protein
MGLQVLGTDKILRLNDFGLLGMVSSEDWAPNFNAQDVMEMGSTARVDTAFDLETAGSLELSSIGNTAGFLARMAVQRTAGAFTGFLYSASNANAYTIDQDDMAEMNFDIIMYERPDQKTFSRAVWLPRCFLTGVTGRVDAQGTATETFNWAGNDVIGFKSPYHDVRCVPATRATSTTLTLQAGLTLTPGDYTLAYVYINEKRIRNAGSGDLTTAAHSGTTVTITTSEGYAIPADAVSRVLFYKTSPSTTFPSILDADRQSPAFFIKGYQADLFLAVADADDPQLTEQWLRVQSLDFNVDLRVEALRQIAFNKIGTSIYARVPTFPLDINMNASVTETDWEDWRMVLTATTGTDVYTDQFDLAPVNLKGTRDVPLKVVVKYYTKDGDLLQTWKFTDMRLDGYANRANVGGRGEVQWTLKGTQFSLVGLNVV